MHGPPHLLPPASAVCHTCKGIHSTALILETERERERKAGCSRKTEMLVWFLSSVGSLVWDQTSHPEMNDVVLTGVGGMCPRVQGEVCWMRWATAGRLFEPKRWPRRTQIIKILFINQSSRPSPWGKKVVDLIKSQLKN